MQRVHGRGKRVHFHGHGRSSWSWKGFMIIEGVHGL